MRPLELGLVLPTIGLPTNQGFATWAKISSIASDAERVGFDTVWIPDELLWKFPPDFTPMGTWECVAMTSAVATVTESVTVGSWVLSALHRNAGLTVKVAETIDEISGGRFLFGLGAGHGGVQGQAFGYPSEKTVDRYQEALDVVVPLLRTGEASYSGRYHSAFEQNNIPRGPQGERMRLLLAGHGPRTVGLAVEHADIWSGYATTSSLPGAFADLIQLVERTCDEQARDPQSLGKSIGVFLEPGQQGIAEGMGLGVPIGGAPSEAAERIHEFAELGVTMLELVLVPFDDGSMAYLAELVETLDG
jgi:alkanesulfonate monooxygenase SsuD/methylene tetrahydromethanopterin reductase-like flavin-dependent oxidoreductase (luciferase family)